MVVAHHWWVRGYLNIARVQNWPEITIFTSQIQVNVIIVRVKNQGQSSQGGEGDWAGQDGQSGQGCLCCSLSQPSKMAVTDSVQWLSYQG